MNKNCRNCKWELSELGSRCSDCSNLIKGLETNHFELKDELASLQRLVRIGKAATRLLEGSQSNTILIEPIWRHDALTSADAEIQTIEELLSWAEEQTKEHER